MTIRSARTPLFAEILTEASPQWAQAVRAADNLEAAVRERSQTTDESRAFNLQLSARLTEEAAKDRPDFSKVIRDHQEQKRALETTAEERGALFTAKNAALAHLEALEKDMVPEAVNVIRDRVHDIQDRTATLDAWPTSAQHAIDTDSLEEWRTIQDGARELDALAKVYFDTCSQAVQPHDRRHLVAAAFITDPLNAHPRFLHQRAKASHIRQTAHRNDVTTAAEQWTHTAPSTTFGANIAAGAIAPEGAAPLAWFAYVVKGQHLTVHQPEHALELWGAAERATAPFDEKSAVQHLTARRAYYELTEDDENLTRLMDAVPSRGRRSSIFA